MVGHIAIISNFGETEDFGILNFGETKDFAI
jgi:hypothetical protein